MPKAYLKSLWISATIAFIKFRNGLAMLELKIHKSLADDRTQYATISLRISLVASSLVALRFG